MPVSRTVSLTVYEMFSVKK